MTITPLVTITPPVTLDLNTGSLNGSTEAWLKSSQVSVSVKVDFNEGCTLWDVGFTSPDIGVVDFDIGLENYNMVTFELICEFINFILWSVQG